MRNNKRFTLGDFYITFNNRIYRYVGMNGSRRVFIPYEYDCTDRTGTWYYRAVNGVTTFNNYSLWLMDIRHLSVDKYDRFSLGCGFEDITCEFLHANNGVNNVQD